MKVLIVEDEAPAAEKLERYLRKFDSSIEIAARLDSVAAAVKWIDANHDDIDLIFMDVQLLDGLSFQIFSETDVRKPVIFTTAFNEFALDAFKANGIDYLLKPITFTDLATSLKKLENLKEQFGSSATQREKIERVLSTAAAREYKTRFMVKLGEHIRSITSDNISLFYADGRDVYLVTAQNRKFIIDYTLEGLESILDPSIFFRLNRTFILNINAIKDVVVYSNSRLKIMLNQEFDKEMIVSREKVSEFKDWFDGARK